MTSPFRGIPLRTRAIELMKEGHTADVLHVRFVEEGEHPDEVRTVLTELVALQHQAAAMDPARLRGEAKWMFLRGAPVDAVVEHFVRVGVPDEHARPEAEKILKEVQRMQPCQRCGTPTEPEKFVMDFSGFKICNGCNLRDEIGRSEQRGVAADLEMMGSFGGGIAMGFIADAISADANNLHHATSSPFCGRCKQPTGVHISRYEAQARARFDPTSQWVCHQCGTKIA